VCPRRLQTMSATSSLRACCVCPHASLLLGLTTRLLRLYQLPAAAVPQAYAVLLLYLLQKAAAAADRGEIWAPAACAALHGAVKDQSRRLKNRHAEGPGSRSRHLATQRDKGLAPPSLNALCRPA